MDITILDSWLRDYLKTKATPSEFAKYVSLSGPTVDRTHYHGKDFIYDIEVTTNRVDAMSVYGIAREAATILPLYNIKAELAPLPQYSKKLPTKGPKLELKSDPKLTSRLMGVVIEDIKNWKTPKWMVERLESAGMRSLNAVVDITNYVMQEVGHPCHVFDYDAVASSAYDKVPKIVVRESKKSEQITSFDNKTYTLSGGDIVFDDGESNIIDLPGIIGLKNTVVNDNTKRVLFFLDTNDAKHIRKTSMELAIRTNAAVLNEKDVDPELAEVALKRGLILFEEVCKAKVASPIYDNYPSPYKSKSLDISADFIENILGVKIEEKIITNILKNLGFGVSLKNNIFSIEVPSFRATDISIPEDIIEEIARMYGYHNLPSKMMAGELPITKTDSKFDQERHIKDLLVRLGGTEVYTFSLVSKGMTGENSLRVSNPLGSDTEYLRNTLKHSLVQAMNNNKTYEKAFIFEMSNVFLQNGNKLPEEQMMLGAVLKGYSYREAKGIAESLLHNLHITDLQIEVNNLENNYFYFELSVDKLTSHMREYATFKPTPEFPAQIEDITLKIAPHEKVGDFLEKLRTSHRNITRVELSDIYERNFTFRIWYQDEKKTLTDQEVSNIRKEIVEKLNLKEKIA